MPFGGTNDKRIGKNSVILNKTTADGKAAARITSWIAQNDINDPKPLSLDVLKLETFDDCVNVLATSNAMRIKRERRGDELRDAVYAYIKQGPLSFDEFAMVFDYLSYDYGLVKTAMHAVMFAKSKGSARVPPEMDRIEAFCKKHGVWGEMLEIERMIVKGMVEKDAADKEAELSLIHI